MIPEVEALVLIMWYLVLQLGSTIQVEEVTGTQRKVYRVAGTLKRITVYLAKENFFSFVKKALTIPRLKKAIGFATSVLQKP